MKKIMSLIKTDFNTTFGLSSIAYSFKNKKNRFQIIIFGILILSILPTYFLLIKGLGFVYGTFNEIGQRSMFLLGGFLISQILVFVFGILYVMSKYYFSNDLAQLVPLPIKPSNIIGSKFIILMISEYITSLPIILPFIFIYGIKGGEGILYWVYSFILVLMVPVIPLVLSSILIMLFMKYTNIGRRKDLLRTITAVLFMTVVIYGQVKINQITQKALMQDDSFLINIIKDSNLLVKSLGKGFPPSQWAALALSNHTNIMGLVNLLVFVGAGFISYLIMIYLSEGIFFDGLIGNIEMSASKGKRGKKVSLKNTTGQTKPYLALAKKEIILLIKTPIYLLNSVGGVILLPIMFLVMSITGGDASLGEVIQGMGLNQGIITLAGIGFIAFLGLLNNVGSTTFSREGNNLWIQRTLPIKAKDQIIGRVLASMAIQLLGLVALLGSMLFIIKFDVTTILLVAGLGLLGSIPMTQIGMVIDIIRPLLTWTNPQQAMKQNLNVLISMGVGALYGGIIGYSIFKILGKVDINLIYIGLAATFIISIIGLYYVLERLITKQFEVLE